ncbi:MAG: glycosyltransferase family 4 protein [Planctomycetes bacterium]|nr:glycosyltransferase family 4 protein [Planctomycetota bacterium]
MNIAFCYETVNPTRGGCETYIADLARRLVADRHEVHLYARHWEEKALPAQMCYHRVPAVRGTRFLRPWRFSRHCLQAMAGNAHDVTVGFDKTFGQDVLYPQAGLHVATVDNNARKYTSQTMRRFMRLLKAVDPVYWSYKLLERRQYLGADQPVVVVNSHMVRDHFQQYYGVPAANLHVVRSAIDPNRFPEHDRLKVRQESRQQWGMAPGEVVALFAAMNYRLKGIDPLFGALARLFRGSEFGDRPRALKLLVVGNPDTRRQESLARKLAIQDRVTFIGHCAEMRRAYFASDFLVHPTFYDPCSLVVLEALACGLPVITTRMNGASELLHPLREGFVIDDPHDHARLAWCMAQLVDGPRRQACSLAARQTAAQWTFEHHYRQLMDVFVEAARRKQAA